MPDEHNCERFCKIPCKNFTLNSPLNKDCVAAVIHCNCHPFWKEPLFWFIFGIVFAVVVTIVRAIYMFRKNRKAKKAATEALNSGRGTNVSQRPNTTKAIPKAEITPESSIFTPAQAIVVESSVV
ncbi:unnamed protein product [Orchesella dallaii]|uniref:Uncharacterized protein n=1 Tax=Orchesella dallaii TaxID=48710 RepID=A0ABP1RV66_9HEXA